MWNLGSLSKDGTCTPTVEVQSLNPWTIRDVRVPEIIIAWTSFSSFLCLFPPRSLLCPRDSAAAARDDQVWGESRAFVCPLLGGWGLSAGVTLRSSQPHSSLDLEAEQSSQASVYWTLAILILS